MMYVCPSSTGFPPMRNVRNREPSGNEGEYVKDIVREICIKDVTSRPAELRPVTVPAQEGLVCLDGATVG